MEFTTINPAMSDKARAASQSSARSNSNSIGSRPARRETRIEEAGAHFTKEAAIFILEQKEKKETTTVLFFATCIVFSVTVDGCCCSLPKTTTVTVPKFRIKDVGRVFRKNSKTSSYILFLSRVTLTEQLIYSRIGLF